MELASRSVEQQMQCSDLQIALICKLVATEPKKTLDSAHILATFRAITLIKRSVHSAMLISAHTPIAGPDRRPRDVNWFDSAIAILLCSLQTEVEEPAIGAVKLNIVSLLEIWRLTGPDSRRKSPAPFQSCVLIPQNQLSQICPLCSS